MAFRQNYKLCRYLIIVTIMIGKKNMVFGFFYFVLTMGLGMYLALKAGSSHEQTVITQHEMLHMAHVHGNVEALLNVILGYLICRLALNSGIAKAVSVLLLIGMVFHSGMLYLGGLGVGFAAFLVPVGTVALMVSMLLIGIGVLTSKTQVGIPKTVMKDEIS